MPNFWKSSASDVFEELDLEQIRIYEELYEVPDITIDEAIDIAEGYND